MRIQNADGELTKLTGRVLSARKVRNDWDAAYGVMRVAPAPGQAFVAPVAFNLEDIFDIALGTDHPRPDAPVIDGIARFRSPSR